MIEEKIIELIKNLTDNRNVKMAEIMSIYQIV